MLLALISKDIENALARRALNHLVGIRHLPPQLPSDDRSDGAFPRAGEPGQRNTNRSTSFAPLILIERRIGLLHPSLRSLKLRETELAVKSVRVARAQQPPP